jgi:hypothetical protein
MGYHTTVFSGRKEAVMIFSAEQALLKAQADLQNLVAFTRQAATDRLRIDQVERELMRRLLALGLNLLPGRFPFDLASSRLTFYIYPAWWMTSEGLLIRTAAWKPNYR